MAVDFKAKNKPPKWKKQEFFSFVTIAENSYKIDVNSVIPIDRIRISVGGVVNEPVEATTGVLVYSNIVNSYVGTLTRLPSINTGTVVSFSDSIEAGEGMNFIYKNKVLLQGSYEIKLFKYDGTVYTETDQDLYILIEYFVDE